MPAATMGLVLCRGFLGGCGASGQGDGEQTDQRQIGADLVDGDDAEMVGETAEHSGADASESEGEAKEHASHHAGAAGHQFLGVDDDGREGGGEEKAD